MESNLVFYTATIYKWYNLLEKDETKQIVIESLSFLVEKKRLILYSFVIMPNHIHIVAEQNVEGEQTKETPFAALLKFTGHSFKQYLSNFPEEITKFKVTEDDRKYRFWQDRPMYISLYSRKVIEQKIAYIHKNPLQEKWSLVNFPVEYEFSSAGFYETGIDKFGILTHISEASCW